MDTHISPSARSVSKTPAQRLDALRDAMSKIGIDGYLVPHGDEHQGDETEEHAHRGEEPSAPPVQSSGDATEAKR